MPTATATATKKRADSLTDAAFELSPIAQMLVDGAGVVSACNAAARQLIDNIAKHVAVDTDEVVDSKFDLLPFGHLNGSATNATLEIGDRTIVVDGVPVGDESHLVVLDDVTASRQKDVEAARLSSMVENAPINMMFADRDLKLEYMNPASTATLRTIESSLPVPVDDIEGSIIDIFHKHPEHQRQLLANPANLPHRATIQVGEDQLELLVSAIFDHTGEYIGAMATWEVVTERLVILEAIRAAAEGDLTQEISLEGDDVYGQTADALRDLLSSLRQSISQLASTAERISESGGDLTRVSHTMSGTAAETSGQANAAAAAAEEVSANVNTVAAGAEEMGASIREIAQNSANAAQVASEAVDVASDTGSTVGKLGESSNEIGQIVKVITSIAHQTNLLALNATIEAARAGEVGKGFAVVANEVKELAKATASATEDISQKIETIQTDTGSVVEAIDSISEIIGQISGIQTTIAGAVEEQAATTSEISRNVTEAAKGSAEIAENITNVASGASDTTEGADQTQQAAQSLSVMADELKQLISSFTY